jgi:hypothetical protein
MFSTKTLTQSDRLNAGISNVSFPGNLAFLALAQHRLGHTDQAQAALRRLREALKKPLWAKDEGSRAFLREAEVIDLDLVFPADPLAR